MLAKVNLTNDGVTYAIKGNFYAVDTKKSDYKYIYFLNGNNPFRVAKRLVDLYFSK